MSTFDERAKDWDTPERVARAAEAAAAIRANVDLARTDRVVDIGAGTGLLGLALLDDIGELVLAEPSDGMLAVIADKLAGADLPRVTAIKLDVVADPPPGDAFDLAVSFLVLHHIKDTAAALAAVRRLLRPGGRIALSDLDTEDGTFHSAEAEGIHHQGFDRTALAELARSAGFVDVETRSSIDIEDEGRRYPAFLLLGRNPDLVASETIAVSVEAATKKAFATAVDWPGWSRSGKTEELALAALADYAPRYAIVAAEAGMPFEPGDYEVVERTGGGGGTDFGVPSSITELDARPVDAAEAKRQARLVEAAWTIFARVAAGAPAELRKGPRGGGRDRDKMVGHVAESDTYYAREIGMTGKRPDPTDRPAIDAMRAEMLEILRQPTDGSALAERTWTARYAARRIAWHALDHAWEMEDRSDPT